MTLVSNHKVVQAHSVFLRLIDNHLHVLGFFQDYEQPLYYDCFCKIGALSYESLESDCSLSFFK